MVDPGTPNSLAGEVYVVEPLGNETLLAISLGADLVNIRAAADVNPRSAAPAACRPYRTRSICSTSTPASTKERRHSGTGDPAADTRRVEA